MYEHLWLKYLKFNFLTYWVFDAFEEIHSIVSLNVLHAPSLLVNYVRVS